MSFYDPESSSIEKFMISRLFYIFIMLPYLSPFTSYNPFYDKIQLITQLPGDFSCMLDKFGVKKVFNGQLDGRHHSGQRFLCWNRSWLIPKQDAKRASQK